MSHDTFKILGAPSISQEWLMLELSNFVQRETISSLAKGMTNHPYEGRGFAQVTHFLYAQLWSSQKNLHCTRSFVISRVLYNGCLL